MVILKQGQKNGKVIQIHPKTLSEITESEHSRFIIKFSSQGCPPCRAFQEWLDAGNLKPKNDVTIYHVLVGLQDSDQADVALELRRVFLFRGVPHFVFTDRTLEPKKTITGWKQQEFEQAVSEYFQ